MKRLVKDNFGLCIALACSFLPAFFYLRTENIAMTALESRDTVWVFISFLLSACVILGCALAFSPSLRRLAYRPVSVIAAGILLALGVLAAAQINISGLASWCISGISGIFIAVGIIEMLGVCLALLKRQTLLLLLPCIGLAFFFASLVWYILTYVGSLFFESVVVAGLGIVAALQLACVLRRILAKEGCSQTETNVGHLSRKKQVWFVFIIGGLLFNFFTMGLTFLPEDAGVASGSNVQMKPGAYAFAIFISLAVLAVFVRGGSSKTDSLDRTLSICLPVAIAIALVSPFTDTLMAESDFLLINLLPYVGIAMLNIIGWTAVVRFAQVANLSAMMMVGLCMAGCSLVMAIGMLVFFFMGPDAQKVSLVVLTSYLVGMLIFLMAHQGGLPARETKPLSEKDTCIQLAEKHSLTPREQEVLTYLSQGRSARYIADQLVISPDTVRTHMKRIYKKCGVHTKEELIDLINEQV